MGWAKSYDIRALGGWGDDPSPTFSADDFIFYFTIIALCHMSLSPTYTLFALLWLFLLIHPLSVGIWGRVWCCLGPLLLLILHTCLWDLNHSPGFCSSIGKWLSILQIQSELLYQCGQNWNDHLSLSIHLKSHLLYSFSQSVVSPATKLFNTKPLESFLTPPSN